MGQDFTTQFIQAFMEGQKVKSARQAHEEDVANRKLREDTLMHQVRQSKLETRLKAREIARQEAAAMEGMAAPPSVNIPNVDLTDFGGGELPGSTVQPRSMEEVLANLKARKSMENNIDLGPGQASMFGLPDDTPSVNKDILAHLPEQVDIPPGLVEGFSGRMPAKAIPMVDSFNTRKSVEGQGALNRAQQASEGALNRQNAQTVANIRKPESAEGGKPLSGEASKTLSVADTLIPEAKKLKDAFEKDYNGAVRGITFGTDRYLSRLKDNVADKLGRLRSGGAINRDEEARFSSQIGATWKDMVFGSKEEAIKALDGIIQEAEQVSHGVNPSGKMRATPSTPTGPTPTMRNPKTGEVVQWDGTAWVKVKGN